MGGGIPVPETTGRNRIRSLPVSRSSLGWILAGLGALVIAGLLPLAQPDLIVTQAPDDLADTTVSGGFSGPQTDGAANRYAWTQGAAYTTFDFTSHRPFAVIVALRSAAIVGGPDAPVHIRINDRDLAVVHPDPTRNDFQTFRLPVPRSDTLQLKVAVEAPSFQLAGDRRTLGTMVQRITVDKREAWSPIGGRLWLFWLLPALGLASALMIGGAVRIERAASPATAHIATGLRYGAVGLWAISALCMAAAFVWLLRLGRLDWTRYYLWFFGTLALALFFGAGALALPWGERGAPSMSRRIFAIPAVRARRDLLRALLGALLIAVTFLFALTFLHAPGTGDVRDKLLWMDNIRSHGLAEGFRVSRNNYPPLTYVILAGAEKAGALLGLGDLTAYKLSLAAFLLVTSGVLLFWTRNLLLVAAVQCGLTVNALALGYNDIYFAPTLLLAFWALQRRRLALFTALFAVSCGIKWQPLILAPLLAVAVARMVWADGGWVGVRRAAPRVLLPLLAVVAVVGGYFGGAVIDALRKALGENILSGNALNLGWLMTDVLHRTQPGRYGSARDLATILVLTRRPSVVLLPRALFAVCYGLVTWRLLRAKATFPNVMIGAFVAYAAYFALYSGVHESHLFPLILIACALFAADRRYLPLLVAVLLVNNVNLLLFYGFDGTRRLPPLIDGWLDLAVLLSLVTLGLFIALFVWAWRAMEGGAPDLPPPVPAGMGE